MSDKLKWDMTVSDAATFLGVHPNTVYNKVSRELIPYVRVGNAYRFNKDELIVWASSNRSEVGK
jgi:excisionase family DNA binding protein